jgi:Na+/H+-translocating membrane pyrophosphatase
VHFSKEEPGDASGAHASCHLLGDPLKETSGTWLNALLKLVCLVGIVLVPAMVKWAQLILERLEIALF